MELVSVRMEFPAEANIIIGQSHFINHVLQHGAELEEIVNIAAVAVVDAQESSRYPLEGTKN